MIRALNYTINEQREAIKTSLEMLSELETNPETENKDTDLEPIDMNKDTNITKDDIDRLNQIKIDKLQFKAFMGKLAAAKQLAALPNSPNRHRYERQMSCCHTILWKSEEEKSTNYCNQRLCPICSSIVMSKLINGYKESLSQCKELWFLTLTAKTVSQNQIPYRIKEMQSHFSRIIKNNTEYNRREKDRNISANGLRKLEIVVAKNNKYHCHYHIIIDSKQGAEFIKDQWLKKWKKQASYLVSEKAQDIRPVDNLELGLTELAKYVAKPAYRQKETNRLGEEIPITPQQRDNILTALFKVRTYKPFGNIRKTKKEYVTEAKYRIHKPKRLKSNEFEWKQKNWESTKGEELGQAKIDVNEQDFEKLTTDLQRKQKEFEKLAEKINKQSNK